MWVNTQCLKNSKRSHDNFQVKKCLASGKHQFLKRYACQTIANHRLRANQGQTRQTRAHNGMKERAVFLGDLTHTKLYQKQSIERKQWDVRNQIKSHKLKIDS